MMDFSSVDAPKSNHNYNNNHDRSESNKPYRVQIPWKNNRSCEVWMVRDSYKSSFNCDFKTRHMEDWRGSVRDGIGEDAHEKRLVMESSSGAVKENLRHTMGDTVKIVQSATELLKTKVISLQDASLDTFFDTKVLLIQLVMQKMTLCSVSVLKDKKYKVVELRSATLPAKWDERRAWLKMFELLATIIASCPHRDAQSLKFH